MSSTRKIAALPIIGAALTLIAFGVVRGVSSSGPPRGTRLSVAIEPPVDEEARAIATRVVRDRLDTGDRELRVVPAGDKLVVEIGEDDREIVSMMSATLERRGAVQLRRLDADSPWLAQVGRHASSVPPDPVSGVRIEQGLPVADDRWDELAVAAADAIGCTGRLEDGKRRCMTRGDKLLAAYLASLATVDPTLAVPADRVAYGRTKAGGPTWRPYVLAPGVLVEGPGFRSAEAVSDGVTVTVREPSAIAQLTASTSVAFLLDGTVRFVGAPVRVDGPRLDIRTTGGSDDPVLAAMDLVALVHTGAVRPLKVVRADPFSRAHGFWPRALPFLGIGAVLLLVAAVLWRSARR